MESEILTSRRYAILHTSGENKGGYKDIYVMSSNYRRIKRKLLRDYLMYQYYKEFSGDTLQGEKLSVQDINGNKEHTVELSKSLSEYGNELLEEVYARNRSKVKHEYDNVQTGLTNVTETWLRYGEELELSYAEEMSLYEVYTLESDYNYRKSITLY